MKRFICALVHGHYDFSASIRRFGFAFEHYAIGPWHWYALYFMWFRVSVTTK